VGGPRGGGGGAHGSAGHLVPERDIVAELDGAVAAIVPDLICVLEADSGEPITCETLRYGQRVTVVAISTPDMMRTPEALAVFGPACFGLDRPFTPIEELARLPG